MLGLVVTPTTLYSSTSCCRLPLRIRSRERSSSQTATPAFDSCARFSFWAMSCPLSVLSVGCGPAAGSRRELAGGGGQRGPFSAVAGRVLQTAGGDARAGRRDVVGG